MDYTRCFSVGRVGCAIIYWRYLISSLTGVVTLAVDLLNILHRIVQRFKSAQINPYDAPAWTVEIDDHEQGDRDAEDQHRPENEELLAFKAASVGISADNDDGEHKKQPQNFFRNMTNSGCSQLFMTFDHVEQADKKCFGMDEL